MVRRTCLPYLSKRESGPNWLEDLAAYEGLWSRHGPSSGPDSAKCPGHTRFQRPRLLAALGPRRRGQKKRKEPQFSLLIRHADEKAYDQQLR